MKLQLLLVFLHVFTVALADSVQEVHGYFGDIVTLPSGANSSWNLATIDWSVFSNNTWIATYRNGRKNTERVDRYKGRLSLNTSSGDLTIHKLTTEDAMVYTVDLINAKIQEVNKIKLIVRQRLQKPTIDLQSDTCTSVKGGCWIKLLCSSTDKGVNFSWQVKPPSVTVFNMSNPDGNSAVLLAFLNTTQNIVEITCTSSRQMESTSSVVTHKCDDDKPQPQPRSRNAICFFIGVSVGLVIAFIAITIYCSKEKIRGAWKNLKGLWQ